MMHNLFHKFILHSGSWAWDGIWDGGVVSTAGLTCTITPPITGSDSGSGAGGSITFSIDVNGGCCLEHKLPLLEARNASTEIL